MNYQFLKKQSTIKIHQNSTESDLLIDDSEVTQRSKVIELEARNDEASLY